jgi:hypothetical protein
MKKVVFASLMVLTSMSFVTVPSLRAQDLTIQNAAEYNAYQNAITQTDPKAKAAALEDFLKTYPQTIVKKPVLDMLVDTYQGLNDFADELIVTKKLLQIDPNNEQAIFLSVYIEKGKCAKTSDAQACDDAEVDGRYIRRRLEKSDRYGLSAVSLGDCTGRCAVKEGLQGCRG